LLSPALVALAACRGVKYLDSMMQGTRSFVLSVDQLVHEHAAEIAARQGSAVGEVVDAVYRSLEAGRLRLVASPLRIEPGGATRDERREVGAANRRMMRVRRRGRPAPSSCQKSV
jgi:hypothetical protein